MRFNNILSVAILVVSAMVVSCNGTAEFDKIMAGMGAYGGGQTSGYGNIDDRLISEETRRVMLLYSAGFNSLSTYLEDDINDLKSGFVPNGRRSDNVLLIFSKLPVRPREYRTKTAPVLFRLYRDIKDNIVADTLLRFPVGTIAASASTFGKVMNYIKENFHAAGYGVIISSHATGWLPNGYYNSPGTYDPDWNKSQFFSIRTDKSNYRQSPGNDTPFPYVVPPQDPGMPAVKSITQEEAFEDGRKMSYEAELEAFANAIPVHLDYILFDACLMGGVEVAYAFKDHCSYIGFSQTEALAEGYDYTTIANHLIGSFEPDPVSVCSDYFEYYKTQSGDYQSATVSLVDCSKLDNLAAVCKELFSKYRAGLANINPIEVQHYFRFNRHWFYDLKDILVKSGASEEDLENLQNAIDASLLYKAATPAFLNIPINTFSGYSMYLPANGSTFLNNFYKTLSWNTATSLVQ